MTLLQAPLTVQCFESAAEAIPSWRQEAGSKPALLLLSNDPHLLPVPEPLRSQVATLIDSASSAELTTVASMRTANPLFLPNMAVDAALRNGWFRELIWALPLPDPDQPLNLEKFKEQLTNSGIAGQDEVSTMSLSENTLRGTLRNTPVRAAALSKLKNVDGPVIVHIDLSYFQPLYKNDISTPLLDIVFNTLITLQQLHLDTLAVTFSYDHLDSQVALDVRFLGEIIPALVASPAMLKQPLPINWKRQRDALYLANFFQKDTIRDLFEAQEQTAPQTAWIKFNLFNSAVDNKEGNKALHYLAEAVTLDPVFALEYFELSDRAYKMHRPDESLHMLELAAKVFPEDPFLKLQMVQLANELGMKTKALRMVEELRTLEWSKAYYPQMPEYIEELASLIKQGQMPDNAGNGQSPTQKTLQTTRPDSGPTRQ